MLAAGDTVSARAGDDPTRLTRPTNRAQRNEKPKLVAGGPWKTGGG